MLCIGTILMTLNRAIVIMGHLAVKRMFLRSEITMGLYIYHLYGFNCISRNRLPTASNNSSLDLLLISGLWFKDYVIFNM